LRLDGRMSDGFVRNSRWYLWLKPLNNLQDTKARRVAGLFSFYGGG